MAVLNLSCTNFPLIVMHGLLAMSRTRMGFLCAGSMSSVGDCDCATAAAEQAVAIAIATSGLKNFGIGHIFRSEGEPRTWPAIWRMYGMHVLFQTKRAIDCIFF